MIKMLGIVEEVVIIQLGVFYTICHPNALKVAANTVSDNFALITEEACSNRTIRYSVFD